MHYRMMRIPRAGRGAGYVCEIGCVRANVQAIDPPLHRKRALELLRPIGAVRSAVCWGALSLSRPTATGVKPTDCCAATPIPMSWPPRWSPPYTVATSTPKHAIVRRPPLTTCRVHSILRGASSARMRGPLALGEVNVGCVRRFSGRQEGGEALPERRRGGQVRR